MNIELLSGLFLSISLSLMACGDNKSAGANCEKVSTCNEIGQSCADNVIATCAFDANGCMIETKYDCGTDNLSCNPEKIAQVCVPADCSVHDEQACVGVADGIAVCSAEGAVVTCNKGPDGCLDAMVSECAADFSCDSIGSAKCTLACTDHPLCESAIVDALTCNNFYLNKCVMGSLGCLELEQTHCGASLCEVGDLTTQCGENLSTGLSCDTTIAVVGSGFQIKGADFVADFAGGINLAGTDTECTDTKDDGTVGAVLAVELQEGDVLKVVENGPIDAVLHIQKSCALDAACVKSGSEELNYTAEVDETVYIVIENVDIEPLDAAYDVRVFVNPVCGNGMIEPGEVCDDSNVLNGDGCSGTCSVEFTFQCDANSPSSCTKLQSLGSFANGDSMPVLNRPNAQPKGSRESYLITFTEDVFLSGTLGPIDDGLGDYDFILKDSQTTFVLTSATAGSQEWDKKFVPAGTYVVLVSLYAQEPSFDSDKGYLLRMNTSVAEPIKIGAAFSWTEIAVQEGSFYRKTITFTKDVLITGGLEGSSPSTDFDLRIFSKGVVVNGTLDSGDEVISIELQAGTYNFEVEAFAALDSTFTLYFSAEKPASTNLGKFTAGKDIQEIEGGALAEREFFHYSIEFTENVILSGSVVGAGTSEVGMNLYSVNGLVSVTGLLSDLYVKEFESVSVPAGKYFLQIRTVSETFGGGDVDGYKVALSTIAPLPAP